MCQRGILQGKTLANDDINLPGSHQIKQVLGSSLHGLERRDIGM